MKKLILAFLSAALLLGVCACKPKSAPASDPAAEPHAEPQPKPQAEPRPIPQQEPLLGGWAQSESSEITDDLRLVFDKAFEGFTGVGYTPLALLKTQVVAGTNYCFLCEATPVSPGAEPCRALVYIYEDLRGNAEVTNIVRQTDDTLAP